MRDGRTDYHSVLVTYFITGFWNPLRSVLLPVNLCFSHILSLSVTLSVPFKPSSPSLSILPFLSHSSHSVPLFDEKPVKVAPAAVQTQMDPRSVCAHKEPPRPSPTSTHPTPTMDAFVLAIITAWHLQYCHHGTKEWRSQRRRTMIEERWNMY